MAHCPQCDGPVALTAATCARCAAQFDAPEGWRPVPDGPEELAEFARLFPGRQPGQRPVPQPSGSWFVTAFAGLLSIVAGGMYGMFVRGLFASLFSDAAAGRSGLMLNAFLFGVPLVVAILSVALLPKRPTRPGAIAWSTIVLLAFTFCAGVFLREGTICIVLALPIFLIMGGIGALLAWMLRSIGGRGPKLLGVALVVPLALGSVENEVEAPVRVAQVHRSIHIAAAPATVWQLVNFPLGIQPGELQDGWAYRIGVPYPIEARTLEPRVGGRRQLTWQRGVRFQEEITRFEPGRAIAWRYLFDAGSFPPGSLDDHVVIGGRYFGLEDTSYALVPEAGGTRLDIEVTYRVGTTFNWYAGWWADFLVDDTAQAILRFYKRRSEASG